MNRPIDPTYFETEKEKEGMPIQLFPNRERMRNPNWHKPNRVHVALAKRAEADREIRPDPIPISRPATKGERLN